MFGHAAKVACHLAITLSMIGISGCASDGGLGELAVMAAMVAPIPGDASALLTTAAVAGGAVALASASSADATPSATPVPGQAQAYKPDLQKLVDRETPERYRLRSCEYIEMALIEVPAYLAATAEPLLPLAGEARRAAASQVWYEKGCTQRNLPRSLIGIQMETVDPVSAARNSAPTAGVLVNSTVAGGGAQKAGILPGDIVVAVNDQPVADVSDIRVELNKVPFGSSANIKFWRAQNFHTIPILVASAGYPLDVLPLAARTNTAPITPSSSTASLQGMSLAVVTPSYAKAVGLTTAQGAWVTSTVNGSAADQAGIKPLDVIVEISGQEVASAQDVADISSRMRAGYKATVSVWRNQAKRDVQMVLRNE